MAGGGRAGTPSHYLHFFACLASLLWIPPEGVSEWLRERGLSVGVPVWGAEQRRVRGEGPTCSEGAPRAGDERAW